MIQLQYMKYNNSVKRIHLISVEMIGQGGKAESKETVLRFLRRNNKFPSK